MGMTPDQKRIYDEIEKNGLSSRRKKRKRAMKAIVRKKKARS